MTATTTPSGAGVAVDARKAELVEQIKTRRLNKRQLVAELGRILWRLEVRGDAVARLAAHNAQLEAELRTLAGVDALVVAEDDLSPVLVDTLRRLGDQFGPLGVIRAALTILGGRK